LLVRQRDHEQEDEKADMEETISQWPSMKNPIYQISKLQESKLSSVMKATFIVHTLYSFASSILVLTQFR
jgi:hypothetical protein